MTMKAIKGGTLVDANARAAVRVNPLDDIKSLQEKENIKLVMKGGDVLKNLL
jgi:hypothetical protein